MHAALGTVDDLLLGCYKLQSKAKQRPQQPLKVTNSGASGGGPVGPGGASFDERLVRRQKMTI